MNNNKSAYVWNSCTLIIEGLFTINSRNIIQFSQVIIYFLNTYIRNKTLKR